MRSVWAAAAGSIVFFLVAPVVIAGVVPRWIAGWQVSPPLLGWTSFRYVGGALVFAGGLVLIDAFARFVRHGRGTPAPPMPTEKLVVTGLYRHVRNPMYLGVLAAIVGQALLLAAPRLLTYAAVVGLAVHVFVHLFPS